MGGNVRMEQMNIQSKGSVNDDAALGRLGKKAVLKVSFQVSINQLLAGIYEYCCRDDLPSFRHLVSAVRF